MKLGYLKAGLAAALAVGAMATAHADVVTFEDVAPSPTFFAEGESFTSGGMNFGVGFAGLGFGVVGSTADFLFATPPTGTAGNFFAALNDSGVTMTAPGGGRFYVAGFDYGFVSPFSGLGGGSPGALVAIWDDGLGHTGITGFDFGDSDAQGNWAMRQGSGAGDLGDAFPGWVSSVTFVACLYDGGGCVFPADNLAQFALDNIAVPTPATWMLVALALGAGGAVRRRVGA